MKQKRSIWKFLIGVALVCLLALLVATTESRRMRAEHQLQDTLAEQVERENALSSLYQLIGYGGFIHNFKNYVLRGKDHYAVTARNQAEAALQALDQLEKSFNKESAGFAGGRDVRSTIRAYITNLDLAISLHKQGLRPVEIDPQVRIDDTSALKGLDEIRATTTEIGQIAFNRAREDLETWQGLRSLVFVLSVVALIGIIFGPYLFNRLLGQTRKQLAFTDDLLNSMEKIADTGYFVRDEAAGTLQASPGLYSLLGIDPAYGPLTFERLTARNSPEERELFGRAVMPKDLGDGVLTKEVLYRPRDGEERILQIRVRSRTIKNKAVVVGLVMDVTDERRNAGDLLTIKQRFDLARESIKMGLWDLNVGHGTVEWDDEMFALYGVKQAEFTGQRGITASLIHEDDREAVDEAFNRFLRNETETLNIRYRATRRDGHEIWVNRRAVARRDDKDRAIRVVGMDIDISREVEVETELRRALKTASAASRTKTDFLAMVSHEVRNPLTTMLGMLHVMELGQKDRQTAEYLAIALENGDHLLRMLNDIIDMSKVETGKLDLVQKPFLPYRLIATVARMFNSMAEEKGLTLETQIYGDSGVYLLGDETRIRQIASNLIGNAVKFTDSGSVLVKITINPSSSSRKPVELRLTIEDTGTPLDPVLAERLFQPPEHNVEVLTTREGGAGLGLSISRRIARMMGGDVTYTVFDEEGKGTGNRFEFSAQLPRAPEERAMETAAAEEGGRKIQPLNILIAESGSLNRRVLEKILSERWDMQVTLVTNGIDALAVMKAHRFDLVMMDVHMPEMNGKDTVEVVRATMPEYATVPILALTANVYEDQRRKYVAAGFTECVLKPFDWDEIERQLTRLSPRALEEAPATQVTGQATE